MHSFRRGVTAVALGSLALLCLAARADEAAIRKNLREKLPALPGIDEVTKSPLPGLWELRVGTDLFYTDGEGRYFIQGSIFDTKQQRNLTEERQRKLLDVPFNNLPL